MAQNFTSGGFPVQYDDANSLSASTGWNELPMGYDFDGALLATAQSQTPSDYSSVPFSAPPHDFYNTTETGLSDLRSHSDGYPCSHSPTDDFNLTGDLDGLVGLPESAFLGLGSGVEQGPTNTNAQSTYHQQHPPIQPTGSFLDRNRPPNTSSLTSSSLLPPQHAPQHSSAIIHESSDPSLALSTAHQSHGPRVPNPTIVIGHNDDPDPAFHGMSPRTGLRPTLVWGSNQQPVNTVFLELAWKLKTIIQRFHLSGPEACVRLSEMLIPQSTTKTLIDDEVAELALQGLCMKLQGFQRRFGVPKEDIVNNLRSRISQLLPSNRPPAAPSDSSLELPFCCLHSDNPALTAMKYRSSLIKRSCAHKRASKGSLYCKKCKGTFDNEIAWRRHIEQTDPDGLWCCSLCNKTKLYHRKDQVLAHLRNVHGMSQKEAHENHERLIVDDGKAIKRQCKECGLVESDWSRFYRHIQKHMKDRASNSGEMPHPTPPDDDDRAAGGSFGGGSIGNAGLGGPGTGSNGYGSGDSNHGYYNPFNSYQFNQNCSHSPSKNLVTDRASHSQTISFDEFSYPSDLCTSSYNPSKCNSDLRSLRDSTTKEGPLCQKLSSLPRIDTNIPHCMIRPRPKGCSKSQYQHHQYCSKYHRIETLWKSRNSRIEQVQDECTKTQHIRKTVTLTVGSHSSNEHFGREVQILKNLRHPHITELVSSFVGESVYSFIMNPVADCSLEQYLEHPPADFRPKIMKWFGCLASAMDYLHSTEVSVRHSDLKPANILVREEDIFIADFGISRRLASPMDRHCRSQPITQMYAAPEIFQGVRDWRADIFALGCVYLEMITVLCNISMREYHRTLMQAITEHRKIAVHLVRLTTTRQWILRLRDQYCNEKCKIVLNKSLDTVDAMLSNDLGARPTAEQVLQEFPHTTCNSHCSRKRPRTPSFPKLLAPVPIATPVEYIQRDTDQVRCDKREILGQALDLASTPTIESAAPPRIVIENYNNTSDYAPKRTSMQISSRPRAKSTPPISDTVTKTRTKSTRSATMTAPSQKFLISPDPKAVHVIEGVLDPSRTPRAQFGQVYIGMPEVQDPATMLLMLQSCLLQSLHSRAMKRRPSERLLKATGNSDGRVAQVGVVNLFGRFRSQFL